MWVLRRTDQGGGYVADMRKSNSSYVRSVKRAKLYNTREEAVTDSCQANEVPIDIGYNSLLDT